MSAITASNEKTGARFRPRRESAALPVHGERNLHRDHFVSAPYSLKARRLTFGAEHLTLYDARQANAGIMYVLLLNRVADSCRAIRLN
jgi:hypothetical protein